jgi:uncharacterized protein YkwD
MLRPRPRRGALPFAAIAALLLPVSAAVASTTPQVGSVKQTTGTVAQGIPPVPVPVPAGTPLSTSIGGCAKAHAQPSRLSARAARAAMLCAINATRAANGLRALGGERHLRKAAHGHARDMVRHRYFAHQRAGGPSFGTRLRKAGWHGRAAGEAIAWGCGTSATVASTVRAWLNSPPHRAILLSGSYHRAGIGIAGHAPTSCGPGATWVLDAGS